MLHSLYREFIYIWYYSEIQFKQIFPNYILGVILGSFISVFLKDKLFSSFKRVAKVNFHGLDIVLSCILGIASPLCLYGTIPVAASFSRAGIKDDLIAAFMMGSILLNPQLIIYSGALGIQVLFIRIFTCFLCGIGAGIIIRYFLRINDSLILPVLMTL